MKKAFLLLIALSSMSLVSARTVKLTVSDYFSTDAKSKNLSFSDQGFTISATQGTSGSTSNPAYSATYGDFCVYAGGTFTVSATDENILSIEFELSSQGKQLLGAITPSTGKSSYVQMESASWAGNAQSVTFTLGAKADYGKDITKAEQFRFLSLRIVTDGTGEDSDDTADLTKEYTYTQGRSRYYGTSYSTNPCFMVEIYSADISFENEWDDDESIAGTGSYVVFDIYTNNTKSFIGTYTTQLGEDKVGGLTSGTSSQWHACCRSTCLSANIVSGSVTFTCTPSGKYNVAYNVTDSEGNKHVGEAKGLNISSYTGTGKTYALSNTCTDADVIDALPSVTTEQNVYTLRGQIVVEPSHACQVDVYNLLGQRLVTKTIEQRFVLEVPKGIYVVKVGNRTSKVIVGD